MVVSHMSVLQFRGPITYCVLQWCHPMLTGTQRRTSCSTRMITLYGDHVIKLDSGPRTLIGCLFCTFRQSSGSLTLDIVSLTTSNSVCLPCCPSMVVKVIYMWTHGSPAGILSHLFGGYSRVSTHTCGLWVVHAVFGIIGLHPLCCCL